MNRGISRRFFQSAPDKSNRSREAAGGSRAPGRSALTSAVARADGACYIIRSGRAGPQLPLPTGRTEAAGRAARRVLEEQAKLQDDAVRPARQSVALTINQSKAGTVSFLNVAHVRTSQLTEERVAVGVLSRRFTGAVGLVRALGGGWRPDAT